MKLIMPNTLPNFIAPIAYLNLSCSWSWPAITGAVVCCTACASSMSHALLAPVVSELGGHLVWL